MRFESGTSKVETEREGTDVPSFSHTLTQHEVKLVRETTTTLQLNTGLLCNQICRHCHLNAGPNRKEIMGPETIEHVV